MGLNPDNKSGSKPRGARGALLCTPAMALLCACALAATVGAEGLVPNPANDPRLLDKPIEDSRYDRATRCRKRPTDGAKALVRWLGRSVRGELWAINRCERLKRDDFSVHAEGRAVDWRLDAGIAKERRSAVRLIRILIATDRNANPTALARRMGVQGLIFDCKAWWSGMAKLDRYGYCYRHNGELRNDLDRTQAHRDHVHIELNWAGAHKRTSFWRSPVSG